MSKCQSRARADAPRPKTCWRSRTWSVPRTRGCTAAWDPLCTRFRVSPAHARMHRSNSPPRPPRAGQSHARADAPSTLLVDEASLRQSRARADAPTMLLLQLADGWSVPRTRGCTGRPLRLPAGCPVSPAHARMHRTSGPRASRRLRQSRGRADAPYSMLAQPIGRSRQSRARADAPNLYIGADVVGAVSPAHARMHRSRPPRTSWRRRSVPRARECTVRGL